MCAEAESASATLKIEAQSLDIKYVVGKQNVRHRGIVPRLAAQATSLRAALTLPVATMLGFALLSRRIRSAGRG